MKYINGFFYVVSSGKKKVYKLDKNLKCECKGYVRHLHCRHQEEVIKDLKGGVEVDISKIPFNIKKVLRRWQAK